jgi:hypothetical protein
MARAINIQNLMGDPVLKDLFGSWMGLFPNTMRARPARLAGGALDLTTRWTAEPLFSDHEIAFFFAGETTLKPAETGSYVDGTR